MEYSFYDFLKLIGSLGLFLYGMKIMSEGLQKVAGDRLRSILTAMTTNRVTGVLTGVLITALIQSSSATTVMVVSFVNAGLLTLAESISVIMGAILVLRLRHGLFQYLDLRSICRLLLFLFWLLPFHLSFLIKVTVSLSENLSLVFLSFLWGFLF